MNFKGCLGFVSLVALAAVLAAGWAPTQPTGTVEFRVLDAPPVGVTKIMVTTRNIQIHKDEMLLEIAEGLPNIEADKLKVKLAYDQRKLIPS